MPAKKAKRGLGLHSSFLLGYGIQGVFSELEKLVLSLEPLNSLVSLKEKIDSKSYKKTITYDIKFILTNLKLRVNKINSSIKLSNEILSMIRLDVRIIPLKYMTLSSIIRNRYYHVSTDEKARELRNQNFKLKFNLEIEKTAISVNKIVEIIKRAETFEEIKLLKEKYKRYILEAIDIFSIGYNETSILVVGRTTEILLDDMLKKSMEEKKLKIIDLKKTKYNEKINILKSNKIINEKNWHDLNSIRIDRNETGHPIYTRFNKNDARSIISKTILIIKGLQSKTN
ncbi:MAG TPA: DUF4145 domain-containing protein [Ignavibacteriaceae bacterium]|nr:DUF4145 domain-containing protein [Ignavibacteriaceae bacterium]